MFQVLGEADRKSASPPPLSKVFPGKVCCSVCGLPVPPQQIDARGMCPMCADEVATAIALVRDPAYKPPQKFKDIIERVRAESGPATIGVTEAFLARIGGDQKLGEMLADDLRHIRGDDIEDESLRKLHTPDVKTLGRFYGLIRDFLRDRDDILSKNGGDPLADLDEESLQALVSNAAFSRLRVDTEFVEQIVREICVHHMPVLEAVYTQEKYGIPVPIPGRASVIVMEADHGKD